MFKDYYSILEIPYNASLDEIKKAFKRQAIKWHPDKNIGKDTTPQMQDINEAYLILKDEEARSLYDREYLKFKKFISIVEHEGDYEKTNDYEFKNKRYKYYDFEDETLKNWVNNARRQSVELAKHTIEEMRILFKQGVKASGKEMGNWIVAYLLIGLFFSLIFYFARSCS